PLAAVAAAVDPLLALDQPVVGLLVRLGELTEGQLVLDQGRNAASQGNQQVTLGHAIQYHPCGDQGCGLGFDLLEQWVCAVLAASLAGLAALDELADAFCDLGD